MEKKSLKFYSNTIGKSFGSLAVIYRMGKENMRTTVPVHGNRDIRIGLLKAI